MKEKAAAGDETAMGSIGLLLRVAPKQRQQHSKKKSTLTTNLKQEINPFMMPVPLGPSDDGSKESSGKSKTFSYC